MADASIIDLILDPNATGTARKFLALSPQEQGKVIDDAMVANLVQRLKEHSEAKV